MKTFITVTGSSAEISRIGGFIIGVLDLIIEHSLTSPIFLLCALSIIVSTLWLLILEYIERRWWPEMSFKSKYPERFKR